MRVLREIEASQWWPEEKLRADQFRRLQLVAAAASWTPHYRRAWAAPIPGRPPLRDLEDLQTLPLLEKATLRADPDSLRNPRYRGSVNTHVTTGSSGGPLSVVRSRTAGAYGRASQIRGRSWFGVRIGDKEVRFGGIAFVLISGTFLFFALRRDKRYFFSRDRTAFLAYRVVAGCALISGDPIGRASEFPELLGRFREFTRFRVSTAQERAALLRRVVRALAS